MSKPVLKNNRGLRSQKELNALIAVVRTYLPIDLRNTRITAEDIIAGLGYASVHSISMDAACNEVKEAPSANRLREVLARALPDQEVLQRALKKKRKRPEGFLKNMIEPFKPSGWRITAPLY